MKRFTIMFTLLLALLVLTGCADNVAYTVTDSTAHVYGFWGGLWHGMIIFFNLIGMIFSDNITIYAPSNNGGWYAFGFWLGGALLVGGGSSSRRRRR